MPFWTVLQRNPCSQMHGLQPVLLPPKTTLPSIPNRSMAGHYAHKTWDTSVHPSQPRPMLKKPLDLTKDQTYYLSSISETGLSRALFPLSQFTKAQVRTLATEWKLPTATRDESMGLCFVGERKRFSEFICKSRPCLVHCRELSPFQHNTSYPNQDR